MKTKQKRWMKSVLATSRTPLPAMPYQRGNRANIAGRLAAKGSCQLRSA